MNTATLPTLFRPGLKILTALAVVGLAGCAWVEPIEGSEQVALVKAANVTGCQKLGHTTSYVKNEVAGLTRNQDTVTQELVTLGKNQAAKMGGDTLVQVDPLKDGKVGFDIYRCRPAQ